MRDTRSKKRSSPLVLAVIFGLVLVGMLALIIVGCGPKGIDVVYGQRKGASWPSVNGTGVLGRMLGDAGFTVFSWGMLSPRLRQRADCIIWFPNDFEPPEQDVCDWLDEWLTEEPDRTLVYVGRDFDAALWYWQKIEPDAPDDQKEEIRRRKWEAKGAFLARLRSIDASKQCPWFTVKGARKHPDVRSLEGNPEWTGGVNPLKLQIELKHRDVRSLEGNPEWTDGVDPLKLQMELNHRLVPSRGAEVVLESDGDMLVSIEQIDRSRVIVVANGSFLLNLPLVNHEHRKLAGQLIEALGPSDQTVVFLQSGPAGAMILSTDPTDGPPTGLEIFRTYPAGCILLHLAAVGVIFCFCRFPIFGRPRDPEPESVSDFGRHVQALGELLQRSGDTDHAIARLSHYRQITRPDSAANPHRNRLKR
jgi:hypothetical protein